MKNTFDRLFNSQVRESFPEYIKNRMQFRYHIYRSLYFLEQGSVKGVKKEVKASSDFYLLFSEDIEEDYDDHVEDTYPSKGSLGSLALDNYESMTAYDGYLPPLLKSRLEYRRGNCMKILSLLNQIYEEDGEDGLILQEETPEVEAAVPTPTTAAAATTTTTPSLTPAKDCFYFTMMASVYFASNMFFLASHYLKLAIQVCDNRNCYMF